MSDVTLQPLGTSLFDRRQGSTAALVASFALMVGACSSASTDSLKTGQAPLDEGGALVTPPTATPDADADAAVRADSALVVTRELPDGSAGAAAVVEREGTTRSVEIPSGLGGVRPFVTDTGFVVAGHTCEPTLDDGGEGGCRSVQGVAAFYSAAGDLLTTNRTPPIKTETLQVAPADGDAVIFVNVAAYRVGPDSVDDLSDGPLTAICGVDQKLFAVETKVKDPTAPEDFAQEYRVMQRSESGQWEEIYQKPMDPCQAAFPFCTPTGIVIGDVVFDGKAREVQVAETGGEIVDVDRTIGIAATGKRLNRTVPQPGQELPTLNGTEPAWVGLASTGKIALQATTEGWVFVDVG